MPTSDNDSDYQTEEEIEEEYDEVEEEEEIGEEEDEVEYEDVEVEEEIEEEEVEIEEEEGEGIGEKEEEAEDDEKANDTSEGLQSDKKAKCLDLIKSTPEELETIIASTGKDVRDLTDNKEASNASVSNILDKHISLEESRSSETSIHEKEIIENRTPDEIIEEVKNLSPQEVNNKESDEKNWMEVDFTLEKEGKVELDGSMLAPHKRPRSSTPVAELENSKKKTAIVCDFYSRGWCIKGNSCPFLHQKEIKKASIAEPSLKESILDGSGSQGESKSKSMSLPSQEKQYSSKPLLQTKQDGHTRTPNQTPKMELFNGSPVPRRYSSPVRSSPINDIGRLNGTLKSSNDYLNNANYSLNPMNSRYNGFEKRYQSSGSSSLPKSLSFFSKLTRIPSKFPAHLRCKVESDESSWEPSVPFVPTYPYIIDRLYPHERKYDSRNVLTNTNALNGSTYVDSRNVDASAFARESYGQSSGARRLSPKEEKHDTTNNSIDVASANNNNEVVASANIVAQGHGSSLKHGEGDMEAVSKESKEMKAFRVALIEFVKELVKPFWHEGRLTKEAHKKVVKKSVEKVICSIEAYQIPSENEAINHYLSANRPKLLRLVEAYVEKYSVVFQA